MSQLFEEAALGSLKLKNRMVRSATWEGIAAPDGSIADTAYELYKELAEGGVGAIITGFTSVSATDFYMDDMMRLSSDDLIGQYRTLTDLIHAESVPVIAQLALGAWYRPLPDDMTKEEIRTVISQFGQAARRAKEAGFDGVQIHAAHFFFLSRFISPRVNHRTDEYGGNTENRGRILLEILKEIRKQAPGLHVTVKINCSDFAVPGLTEEESLILCRMLDEAGIDSMEISGNGTSVGGIRPHVNEGYFAPFAAKVSEAVSAPVIAVGGWRSMEEMEKALQETSIAFLSLSRPLLRQPDLPRLMEAGEATESECISCNRCYHSPCHRCVFRR